MNGDMADYMMGTSADKRYNYYVYIVHNGVKNKDQVYKTYRLEVFAQSDRQCLMKQPENDVFYAKRADKDLVKRGVRAIGRVNETQVGDGTEPKKNQ